MLAASARRPKRRDRARAIGDPATGGFSFPARGPFAPGLPWRQRAGADPSRVALPMRRRRRDGGPPLPFSRLAAGSGALRPGRAEAARESGRPIADRATGGLFSRRGRHVCRRFLGAGALGRTRGRVALPMRRRRRDGGPPLPSSRQAAGSGAASARAGRRGEGDRAPLSFP